MNFEIIIVLDGTRWLIGTKPDGTTKRERIDPDLLPALKPKALEDFDF